MEIDEFISACKEEEEEIIVQKFLIEGDCYFFKNVMSDKYEEYLFKKDISQSLGVHIRDITIVGSGKLGFSIKPSSENLLHYEFKTFDSKYHQNPEAEPSDLDIAIISESLFDQQLLSLYEFTNGYHLSYDKCKSFAKYILKGWIRPDFLPPQYSISTKLEDIKKKYKEKYKRKINIGIYKSWFYFENYHKNNINSIKLTFIANS